MHSSFHLSCNSFPFFVCQLAEGFLMRQETVARSLVYFGFLVRIAKIPRLTSWRMFTNYPLYLWCLVFVLCDCENAGCYDGMAEALLGVRDALVDVPSLVPVVLSLLYTISHHGFMFSTRYRSSQYFSRSGNIQRETRDHLVSMETFWKRTTSCISID
jgi:hypothetical protein